MNDIFRKVLCFHYNKVESRIKNKLHELDLEALAKDSHTAKEDPLEHTLLEILDTNIKSMQPQRQGLSEDDQIDIFEERFIKKTIQNL